MPQRRRRLPPEWKRIRRIFRERRASYDTGEVSELLGISPTAVQAAIEEKTIIPIRCGRESRIAWEDVLTLALEHRWTYRMLTLALRGLDEAALPPLVRVVSGSITLPWYQWKVLRFLAARQSREERREITVSDLVEVAVSTAVLSRIKDWAPLEAEAPGVQAAAAWPVAGGDAGGWEEG